MSVPTANFSCVYKGLLGGRPTTNQACLGHDRFDVVLLWFGGMRRASVVAYRDGHEDSADHERPGPSEADKQRDSEIAQEVVDLPTELRAGCPFDGAEGGDHKQDHDGPAANFCAVPLRSMPAALGYAGSSWNGFIVKMPRGAKCRTF